MVYEIDKFKGMVKAPYASQTMLDCKAMSMEEWIKRNGDERD